MCRSLVFFATSFPIEMFQELLVERGLEVDHTTVWRWVQRYAPDLEERTRPHPKPTNKCWRVDETYVRVKGRWRTHTSILVNCVAHQMATARARNFGRGAPGVRYCRRQ